jgi:hypothetical protein
MRLAVSEPLTLVVLLMTMAVFVIGSLHDRYRSKRSKDKDV